DVFALVTEILRDGERDKARTDAQGRRTVRSRADDDGALHAFRTKIVFQESAYFAVAFADQRDDRHVSEIVPRHRPQQRTLTHTAASENPDALSFAAGKHAVDRTYARHQGLSDVLAVQRVAGRTIQIVSGFGGDGWTVVDRLTEAVQHTSEQSRANAHAGLLASGDHRISQLHPAGLFQRNCKHSAVAKAYNLRADGTARRRLDLAEIADGGRRAARCHYHPGKFHDLA